MVTAKDANSETAESSIIIKPSRAPRLATTAVAVSPGSSIALAGVNASYVLGTMPGEVDIEH